MVTSRAGVLHSISGWLSLAGSTEISYIRLQVKADCSHFGFWAGWAPLEGVNLVAQNLLKHLGASTCCCKWAEPVGRPSS